MIRVLIVDDHQLVAEGIKAMLQCNQNFYFSGCAYNANECLDFLKKNTVDVILMDISLPDMYGVDLCKLVIQKYNDIKIIAISTYSQGTYIMQMIQNGAKGYLIKNADSVEIENAILKVNMGETYFSKEASKIYELSREIYSDIPVLTKREKEVLLLIANGLTNHEIAEKLFLSIDTIDSHRKNLYHKLKVKNTAMLLKTSLELGFI